MVIGSRVANRILISGIAGAAMALAVSAGAQTQPTLSAYVQPQLKDLTAEVNTISHNDAELEKIGKGYVDAYKLGKRQLWCKEPNQVRFEGKQGIFTIRYITNGNKQATDVPTLHIHRVEDITREPAKGNSISDLGLITQGWVDRMEDRWLRSETKDGRQYQVFEAWYKEDPRLRTVYYVDPTTKTVAEFTEYHRNRKKPGFRKRVVFTDVKKVNGVNVPTKATLYNGEGKVAAQMNYEAIKVNTNLPDSMFKL